jgi:site-specific DNA recombinase
VKQAAIYARVSTAEQVKGTSLDGQVALCEQYAKEAGYTVIKAVQEDASGSRLDRPKLGELRDMAARREIEALIVFDPDRLSRSMAHTMMLMEEFERNKADVLFVNAPREDTPEGEMLFGMRALFAQYERTKIAERTRRGKERRVREGQVMTTRNCPFGYEYIASEKRLQVLDSEAVWVSKIFEWAVYEGCSLREIARRLNGRGVPTKAGARAWGPATIRAILDNEAYAGTWHYGRYTAIEPKRVRGGNTRRPKSSKERKPRSEWLSVPVPSIVSQELYDAVAGQLERNRAMSPRNSKRQYLLKGLLFCARCGHRMTGATARTKGHYECPGHRQKSTWGAMEQRCDQPNISQSRIENAVWDEVVLQLSDEKVLRRKLEEREAELQRGRKDDEAELEILINLELGLKREADTLLDLHMSDVIDRETLQERMSVIREKQANITRSKAEVTAHLIKCEQGPSSREAIAEMCALAREGLPNLSLEGQRRFLEGMDAHLKLDGKRLTITGLVTERTLTIADKRATVGIVSITPTGDIHNHPLSIPFYAEIALEV